MNVNATVQVLPFWEMGKKKKIFKFQYNSSVSFPVG